MDWWRLYAMVLCVSTVAGKDMAFIYPRIPASSGSVKPSLPLLLPNNESWSAIQQKLQSTARTLTALYNGSHRKDVSENVREKRDHPLNKIIFRDDKGVGVLEALEPLGVMAGSVQAAVELPQPQDKLLVASILNQRVLVSELDLISLKATEVASFSGSGTCGFSQPSGLILLVCGPGAVTRPLNINEGDRVLVRQLRRTSSGGYQLQQLQPVFMRNVLSTVHWQQDGEYYLLLADNKDDGRAPEFRSANRFFAKKESSSMNFDSNVQIYKWMGHNYDLIQDLPAVQPLQVMHFIINNFNFIVVAEGDQNGSSAVYRYSLELRRYVLLQRLKQAAPARGVAVFTLGTTIEKDTFIALATDCAAACKEGPITVVYKYSGGRFLPFQALRTPSPTGVQTLQNDGDVLLSITCVHGNVHFFQYSGWRFVEVTPSGLPHTANIGGAVALKQRSGENILALACSRQLPASPTETKLFRPRYSWKTPLREHYASLTRWLRRSLRAAGVAEAVHALAKSMPRTDEPYTVPADMKFTGNVVVDSKPLVVEKTYETSSGEDLPPNVEDSFEKLDLLNRNLLKLKHQRQQLVSLSSSDGWPGTVRLARASVTGNGIFALASVNKTINGYPVPALSSLIPLKTSDKKTMANANFKALIVKGDLTVETMNGVPWPAYVTKQGDHNITGTATLLEGASTPHLTVLGRVNGKVFERDLLLKKSAQTITGDVHCVNAFVAKLSCSAINSVHMNNLFRDAVTTSHVATEIRGSLQIAGNLSFDGNINAKVFGVDISDFSDDVFLKTSSAMQIIGGKKTFSSLRTNSLKVNGLLNNVNISDVFLNKRGQSYALKRGSFGSISAKRVQINRTLNELQVFDGELDLMRLNRDQVVNGSKLFLNLHLSDASNEPTSQTTAVTTTEPSTELPHAHPEESYTERLEEIQFKISKLLLLRNLMGNFTYNAFSAFNTSKRISLKGNFKACYAVENLVRDIDAVTGDLKLLEEKMIECTAVIRFIRSLNSGTYLTGIAQKLSTAIKPALAKVSLELQEAYQTVGEITSFMTQISTTPRDTEEYYSNAETELERQNEWQRELETKLSKLNKILSNLKRARSSVDLNLLPGLGYEDSSDWYSPRNELLDLEFLSKHENIVNPNDAADALSADLAAKIEEVTREAVSTEAQLADVTGFITRLQKEDSIRFRPGRRGGGTRVAGLVAGHHLQHMDNMLQSMSPSVEKQMSFFVENASLISNLEFRSDVSVTIVNGIEIRSILEHLLPLTSSNLPLKFEFVGKIETIGDLSGELVNTVLSTDLLKLAGDHTLHQLTVLKDNSYSQGPVASPLVNDWHLRSEMELLAKTNEYNQFSHSVSFIDLEAAGMTAETVDVSGVRLSDVLLSSRDTTITGSFKFSSLHVLSNVTKIGSLISDEINSVNVTNLLQKTLRKSGLKSQEVRGRKMMKSLQVIGNVSTEGFTSYGHRSNPYQVAPVYDFKSLSKEIIYLASGGTLAKQLNCGGRTTIGHLQVEGAVDNVKLPGAWLQSTGDQHLTAPTVLLPTLRSSSLTTAAAARHSPLVEHPLLRSSALDTLIRDTVKTHQPVTFKNLVNFASSAQFVQPLSVTGTVQGLSLPADVVPSTASAVTFTGYKVFLDTVTAGLNITSTVNEVHVDSLCAVNNVVNVTITGDATFETSATVNYIQSGEHTLPVNESVSYWRMGGRTSIQDRLYMEDAAMPTGVTTEKMNSKSPEEKFNFLIRKDCEDIEIDNFWSFTNLTLNNATLENLQTGQLQGWPTSSLRSVLRTTGNQTITGFYYVTSATIADVQVTGAVNGVPPASFCHHGATCHLTADKTFSGDLHVTGDVLLRQGSSVQGVKVRAAAQEMVSRSRGGRVRGTTRLLGDCTVRGAVSCGGTVSGVTVSQAALLTRSQDRLIRVPAIISSDHGVALTATSLEVEDGLVSNHSLTEFLSQSVLKGSGQPLQLSGVTVFNGPVTFHDARSLYAAPAIAAPSELKRLQERMSTLATALQVEETTCDDTDFLGWKEVQRLSLDLHKVQHLGGELLAMLPWTGNVVVLRRQPDGLYGDHGLMLQGTCVSDVSSLSTHDGLHFVVSDGCHRGDTELSSGLPGWHFHALLDHNVTFSILTIEQKDPLESLVFNLNGRPCVALVGSSSLALPVVCYRAGRYELLQELPVQRAVKASATTTDSTEVLVVAALGSDLYGGILDFWIYDDILGQFYLSMSMSEPGLSWVTTTEEGPGAVLVATVNRGFAGHHHKELALYRISAASNWTASLLQRISVPRAREVMLLRASSHDTDGGLQLLVLTLDGVVLRYTATHGGSFLVSGGLQQRDVVSLTAWQELLQSDESSHRTSSLSTAALAVLSHVRSDAQPNRLVLFNAIDSSSC